MRLRTTTFALAFLVLVAADTARAADPPAAAVAACPPPDWSRARLDALAERGFEVPSTADRQALALALLPCLAAPDPSLRDGVAYEALASWMRSNALTVATRRAILGRLLPVLATAPDEAPTGDGFHRPFAALVLSEVARTDRIEPWLEVEERQALLDAAVGFLPGVRDYRGFDEEQGWRHGVAHGADLLLQLALNPALDRRGLDRILEAVATQVVPPSGTFYVYGEPARLARPVLAVASRGVHSPAEWSGWLAGIADPSPLPGWRAAFSSQAGLAKRHDTLAFLRSLYVGTREAGDAELEARLLPGIRAALATVP